MKRITIAFLLVAFLYGGSVGDAQAQPRSPYDSYSFNGLYIGPFIGFSHAEIQLGNRQATNTNYRGGGALGFGLLLDKTLYTGGEIYAIYDSVNFTLTGTTNDNGELKLRYTLGTEFHLGTLISPHIVGFLAIGWERDQYKLTRMDNRGESKDEVNSFSGGASIMYHVSRKTLARLDYRFNVGGDLDGISRGLKQEHAHGVNIGFFYLF